MFCSKQRDDEDITTFFHGLASPHQTSQISTLLSLAFFNPRLGVGKCGVEKSWVEKLMVEKSGIEKFGVGKFMVDRSGIEKSGVGKFMVEKSGVERSGVEVLG